jgi:hypothetical protein
VDAKDYYTQEYKDYLEQRSIDLSTLAKNFGFNSYEELDEFAKTLKYESVTDYIYAIQTAHES